jgi:hypothetical protein
MNFIIEQLKRFATGFGILGLFCSLGFTVCGVFMVFPYLLEHYLAATVGVILAILAWGIGWLWRKPSELGYRGD